MISKRNASLSPLARLVIAAGLTGSIGFAAADAVASEKAAAATSKAAQREAVRVAVAQSFAKQPGYEPGDLVTRRQVEAALDHVEKTTKYAPARDAREKLVKSTIDDRSFLAEQLRSPQGKSFMRRVAMIPGGFDLVDRMGQMKQGHSTVSRLVRGPDGYKLVEYMLKSKGGGELERMLAKDPGNADFGKPTGKIYTAEQLVAALEKVIGR
jgi:hypothetical protein